jgi:hypothetical protein
MIPATCDYCARYPVRFMLTPQARGGRRYSCARHLAHTIDRLYGTFGPVTVEPLPGYRPGEYRPFENPTQSA